MDTVALIRLYVLVFIEHGIRRMHLGGIIAHPTDDWTVQQARNLAVDLGERFGDFRFPIRDRGSNFPRSFDVIFQAAGVTIVRTAVQPLRMNAIWHPAPRAPGPDPDTEPVAPACRPGRLPGAPHHRPSHQGTGQRIPNGDPGSLHHRSRPRNPSDPTKTHPERPDEHQKHQLRASVRLLARDRFPPLRQVNARIAAAVRAQGL